MGSNVAGRTPAGHRLRGEGRREEAEAEAEGESEDGPAPAPQVAQAVSGDSGVGPVGVGVGPVGVGVGVGVVCVRRRGKERGGGGRYRGEKKRMERKTKVNRPSRQQLDQHQRSTSGTGLLALTWFACVDRLPLITELATVFISILIQQLSPISLIGAQGHWV